MTWRSLVPPPPIGFSHDPQTVLSPKVHLLAQWWTGEVSGQTPVPRRAQLSPRLLKPLLPNLIVAEYLDDGRVRYRLVGTRIAELGRFDFTGMLLDEMDFNDPMDWQAAYATLRADPRPLYGKTIMELAGPTGDYSPYEFGMFPLSFDGRTVRQVVAVEDYGDLDLVTASTIRPVRRRQG